MNEGWIKLHRKMLDGGMLTNQTVLQVWIYFLLRAAHKTQKIMLGFQEIEIQPGQLITGRKTVSKELKISEQNYRTVIHFLEKHKKVTIKTTNKFSIVSIINWDIYQSQDFESNHQNNQRLTSSQPASNHIQECKNDKNEKNEKNEPFVHQKNDEPQEEIFYLTSKKKKLAGKRLTQFLEFWKAFGYLQGKAAAAESFLNIPDFTDELFESEIIPAARQEASQRTGLIAQGRTPKMAQGWITERRWEGWKEQEPKTELSINKEAIWEGLEERARARLAKMDEDKRS